MNEGFSKRGANRWRQNEGQGGGNHPPPHQTVQKFSRKNTGEGAQIASPPIRIVLTPLGLMTRVNYATPIQGVCGLSFENHWCSLPGAHSHALPNNNTRSARVRFLFTETPSRYCMRCRLESLFFSEEPPFSPPLLHFHTPLSV